MSSREQILNSIRSHKIPPVARSTHEGPWITFANPAKQFKDVLHSIGGTCIEVSIQSSLHEHLQLVPEYLAAKRVVSLVSGVVQANVELDSIDDPHELDKIDFAILPGQFCVAENGAVWVSGKTLRHRAIYYATEHLAFVVSANDIVSNMHEAYQRLHFNEPGFGAFIAGPSKTADIEQALVIGAQGARSMTVFLVGS